MTLEKTSIETVIKMYLWEKYIRLFALFSGLLLPFYFLSVLSVGSAKERLDAYVFSAMCFFTFFLFRKLFKKVNLKIEEKNKPLYTSFGFACLIFQTLCAMVFVLFCSVNGPYVRDIWSFFFLSSSFYCALFSFILVLSVLEPTKSIKQIRFWGVLSLLWFIFFSSALGISIFRS